MFLSAIRETNGMEIDNNALTWYLHLIWVYVLLIGVAEQFALAEAAMNAWPSSVVTDCATTSTVQLQGMNILHAPSLPCI